MTARLALASVLRFARQNARLASGCALLAYLALHMINHSLGLWSFALAERALVVAVAVWTSAPGTVLLYGAAAVHIFLALRTIYLRPHLRLGPIEAVRLAAGFSLPVLLLTHVIGSRAAYSLHGAAPTYERIVESLIVSGREGLQLALLAPGWLHGCIGFWYFLRRRRFARRIRPALLAFAVFLPLTSAAGFGALRREALARMESRGLARPTGEAPPDAAAIRDDLDRRRRALLWSYVGLLGAAFGAGQWRNFRRRRDVRRA